MYVKAANTTNKSVSTSKVSIPTSFPSPERTTARLSLLALVLYDITGNPYFIDLETLISEGLLTREECDSVDFGTDEQSVDYEKQYNGWYVLLRKACERSRHKNSTEYKAFLEKNETWVYDYCLYMAVKNHFGGMNWTEWPEAIHSRTEEGLREYKEKLADEIDFQLFMQFQFFNQWYKLRAYANKKGIKIIGDIPIYVSLDSADAWSHPELFQLDEQCTPKAVAGCPPDGFSADGQMWGNPLYDWDYHKKTAYAWWIERLSFCFELYDVVRIDHFRGFDEYYSIPYGDKTAVNGSWKKGPGMDLFRTIEKKIGRKSVIAEDLGYITDTVRKLVADSGFMGTKVLEFAFDTRDMLADDLQLVDGGGAVDVARGEHRLLALLCISISCCL